MTLTLPFEIIEMIFEYLYTDTRTIVNIVKVLNMNTDIQKYFEKALYYTREMEIDMVETYEKCGIDDGLSFSYLCKINTDKYPQIYKTMWSIGICRCTKACAHMMICYCEDDEKYMKYTSKLIKDNRNLNGINTEKSICVECIENFFKELESN
jgi:hypothetical protein